jgi:hypothetical protein
MDIPVIRSNAPRVEKILEELSLSHMRYLSTAITQSEKYVCWTASFVPLSEDILLGDLKGHLQKASLNKFRILRVSLLDVCDNVLPVKFTADIQFKSLTPKIE